MSDTANTGTNTNAPKANSRVKWTKETIAAAAKQFDTRKAFSHPKTGNQSAYQAARKLNILDEVCAHMDKVKRGRKAGQVGKVKAAAAAAATSNNAEAEV